jgi:DNA-binding beta-propeller fold protein YncE
MGGLAVGAEGTTMPANRHPRRVVLNWLGLGAGASLLASCAASPHAPRPTQPASERAEATAQISAENPPLHTIGTPTVLPPPAQAPTKPLLPTSIRVVRLWSIDGAANPLKLPAGLAMSRQGRLYIIDAGHDRIQVYDRDGRFVASWGGPGSDDGQFRFLLSDRCNESDPLNCLPNVGGGVAIDGQERVYVADYGNARVQVFDPGGRLLARWGREGDDAGEFRLPRGLAVDERGRVYVSDSENHRIQVFDDRGRPLGAWGSRGGAAGRLLRPSAVAITPRGQICVADPWNFRVQIFDDAGRFVAHYAWPIDALSPDPMLAARPSSIAIDDQGQFYLAGLAGGVQKLDATGRLMTRWGTAGEGGVRLGLPSAIAIDSAGDLYVADLADSAVQKFRQLAPVMG